MTRVIIHPGICGFTATIEVKRTEKRKVSINIISDCEKVTSFGESLTELDVLDALRPRADSKVYAQASKLSLHVSCPVPVGVLKAIEVEADLALPHDVAINFET